MCAQAGAPEIAFHDGRELRGAPPNQLTFTPEQAAEIRHGYFANIAYFDAQLGNARPQLHDALFELHDALGHAFHLLGANRA